jgi:enterobacterial common antigen flippase
MTPLWVHVAEAGAARVFTLVVSLGTLLLTARVLGLESLGMITASVGWVSLFANLGSLSLGQVAHYRIQVINRKDWFPDIFGGLAVMFLILSTLACLVAIAVYQLSNGRVFKNITVDVLIVSFALLPLIIGENYLSNLLAALDRLRWYNFSQYFGRSLTLIMTVLFLVVFDMGVCGAIIAQVTGQTVVVIIGVIALFKGQVTRLHVNLGETVELLKGSARLHFNTIGSFILAQSTVLFLNNFCSTTEVALYHMAYQVMMTMLLLPQAASIVFFSQIAQSDPDRAWPEQKKLIIRILCLVALLALVAYVFAPMAIPILAGDKFLPAVEIFRTLLPCLIGLSLAQLMTPQWISRGSFLATTIMTAAAAVLTVALNSVWIPRFGVNGAVWVSLIVYFGFTSVVQIAFAYWCGLKSKLTSLLSLRQV